MSFLSAAWEVAQAAMAGLFGGLVAPWLLKTGERRRLRAEVRDALGQVEYLRSADDQRPRKDFEEAVRRFETAALMARVPYRVSGQYVTSVRKARRFTEHTVREPFVNPVTGEEVHEPILLDEYGPILRSAAELVNSYLWRPIYTRIEYRGRKFQDKLHKVENKIRSLPSHPSQLQEENASQESLKEAMNRMLGDRGDNSGRVDRVLIERVVREAAAYGFINAAMSQGREFKPPLIEWTEDGDVARIASSEGWVIHRVTEDGWRETDAADVLEGQQGQQGQQGRYGDQPGSYSKSSGE